MAVIVTDLRTVITEADSITGWNQGEYITDFFVEAPGCVAVGNAGSFIDLYFGGTARNATNMLIYVYAFNNGLQYDWDSANFGVGLQIGDGSNRIAVKMAGGNKRVFSHQSLGPVDWQSLVLDTDTLDSLNTAGLVVARAGSYGALNVAALTQFGMTSYSISKALGGGYNQAVDIIRIGNDGILIAGGTTGDRGTFSEIVAEDRNTANLKAHGIIREYATGFYGSQGPLNFGDVTGNSWFDDSNVTLIFEDRAIGNDKYYFRVRGGTGETHFFLNNVTVATAGPFVTCLFNDDSVNALELINCNFTNLGNAITFGTDVSAQGHVVDSCNFTGCGQINPGLTLFKNNIINNSASSATGALILDRTDNTSLENLVFTSGGSGHAIYITAPGSYEFTNFTYYGYGADGTTDAVVYNNSGGDVTILVSGGYAVTVRNGAGASTTVSNVVTITLTGMKDWTEVRVYEYGTINEIAGIEDVIAGSVDNRSWSFSANGGQVVDIRIFNIFWVSTNILNYTVPSSNTSIPVTQVEDWVYENPA